MFILFKFISIFNPSATTSIKSRQLETHIWWLLDCRWRTVIYANSAVSQSVI